MSNPRPARAERPAVGVDPSFVPGSRLHIAADKLDPTLDYTWIRDEVMGQADNASRNDAMRRGFQPVAWSQIGGNPVVWPGSKPTDDFIRDAGVVLCARPKHTAEAEREWQRQETESQMKNSIQDIAQFRQAGDPRYVQRMPEEGVRDLGVQRGRFADA